MKELIEYQKNITSQNGEDGIIEEIFSRLKVQAGVFVEFGAWDGKFLSNSYNLLHKGWKGVYIEGDKEKYKELLKTQSKFSNQIVSMCNYVDYEGENTLDNLLKKTSISQDFDLLSIDIDSYDWHVWWSLKNYTPKIVIIEGNSSVLPGVWQTHLDGVCQGSSFSALVKLGEDKGYKLICHTGNLVFAHKEIVEKLNIDERHLMYPETLFNYKKYFEETGFNAKTRSLLALIKSPLRNFAIMLKLKSK